MRPERRDCVLYPWKGKQRALCLLTLLALAGPGARAELTSAQTSDNRSITQFSPGTSVTGEVGVKATGYLYAPQTSQETVYPMLVGQIQGKTRGKYLEAMAEPEGMFLKLPDHVDTYFEIPQIYFGTAPSVLGPVQVSIGRKLENWNHLDEQWKLGIWQPRYRWDYLNPETVGLTGAFVSVRRPWFRMVAFGSFLYIPERGVPVNSNGGQLTSDSPWFLSPPREVNVLGRNTPTQYDLMIPPVRQIVLQSQPSYSFMVKVGRKKGLWVSGAFAHKPMNQLLLSYGGQLQYLVNRSKDVVNVPIAPRVQYHSLLSAETGYHADSFNVWFSALWDRPSDDDTPGNWTYQKVSNSFAFSPTFEWIIQPRSSHPGKLDFSYLRQFGGNAPDYSGDPNASSLAINSGSTFEERYPYQDALSFSGTTELDSVGFLGSWARFLTLDAQLLWDVGHQGTILTTDFTYQPRPSWKVSIGADILGTYGSSGSDVASATDFISQYQSNDRIRWGFLYDF